MSGPATFSYAQAAKGHAAAQASTTTSSRSLQSDSLAKDDASSVTTGPDAAANTFSTTSEISESAKSSQVDVDVAGSKDSVETTRELEVPASKEESSTSARDETHKINAQSTSDKSTRQSNRSTESADSKKGRKGRKGKNSDKDADSEQAAPDPEKEVVPVKLYEAPPPAVNIWAQRAAQAKARQPSVAAPAATSAQPSKPVATDAPTKSASEPQPSPSKSVGDQTVRRNPRGSREKSDQSPGLPSAPAEDASMWPTPDTAAAEDGKRKPAAEPEQPKEKVDDGNKSIRQKPNWKKVEITPTVVFNTPMPQSSGRPANKTRAGGQAGRSSAARGQASSTSVSVEKTQAAAPEAPGAKESVEAQSKPREDAPPRAAPATSERPTKRFPADQSQRKQSTPAVGREYPPSKNESSKSARGESSQFGSARPDGQDSSRKEGGFSGHKDSKPRRGGHNSNGRGGHNGQPSYMSNGARSSTYSPPNFSSGYPPNTYGSSNGSRGRPGRPAPLGNGYKGPSNGSPNKMSQHSHHSASVDYGQYPAYSNPPYGVQANAADYFTLMHLTLKQQLAYYFSEANLIKDNYLKAHMDAQGFVLLDVIADFRRIRQISSESRDALRTACADSKDIDFVVGDGKELLRPRENWQRWLPEDVGDRNPGPTNIVQKSWDRLPNFYPPQPVPYPSYNPMSPPTYGAPYHPEMYPGYVNGPPPFASAAAINGAQVNGHGGADGSPLNASVPEFSPVQAMPNGFPNAFSSMDWVEQAVQAAQTFTDEQVSKLHMVAHGQMANSHVSGKVLNGSAGAATDGPKEESSVQTNGNTDSLTTPEVRPLDDDIASPTYWALDGSIAQVSDSNNKEAYVDVHARGIQQRRSAEPGVVPADMRRLYKFWAHFLTTNFNPGMYMEFRKLALEDANAEVPSKIGLGNLLQFYKVVLAKSQESGLWPASHPVYKVLQIHCENAQEYVGSDEQL